MQQDSRGDSCGQSKGGGRRVLNTYSCLVLRLSATGHSCGLGRGGGRRYTQHLHLFGPQVKCNRSVEEIAVDRAREEAEEYSKLTVVWCSG